MKLIIATLTAAAFLWLAVIVTIVRIVADHIVAVSLAAAVLAAVLLTASVRRRRARNRARAAGPTPAAALGGRHLALVCPQPQARPPHRRNPHLSTRSR